MFFGVLKIVLCSLFIISSSFAAFAADATIETTNMNRKCAPSENLRLKIEGQVGGFIARKLAGAEASGEVEVFQDGELLGQLIEASPNDAVRIYQMYLDCLKPQIDRYLEANVTRGPTEIRPGQYFSMEEGASVRLFGGEVHFTLREAYIRRDGRQQGVRVTLVGLYEDGDEQLQMGTAIRFESRPCLIALAGYDRASRQFRFLLQCR